MQQFIKKFLEIFQKWIDNKKSGVLYSFRKWNGNKKTGGQKTVINQNKFEGAIRAAGYTQNRLAIELNMSANTFSTKKKNGTFTIAQVEKICSVLCIDKPEDKCDIFLTEKFQ